MSTKAIKKWYVYIIRCADKSLYTGITTDVQRRFKEHTDQGKLTAKYLRGKNPLSLVSVMEEKSRSEASKRECAIKKMSKLEKEYLLDR